MKVTETVGICVYVCILCDCSLLETTTDSVQTTVNTNTDDVTTSTIASSDRSTQNGTTVSSATISPPILPSLPLSTMASMNKVPGGIQSALLPLLIGDGSLDMNMITQLMSSLAPQLPALLKGMLKSNTSGLTESEKMCHEDTDLFIDELLDGKMWAISMLDASGKPGPALLKGAVKFYGNFEECLEVVSDVSKVTGRAVRGDTCVVTVTPPSQLTALQEAIPASLSILLALDWHLCVPTTCGSQSIREGLQDSLSKIDINITQVVCHTEVKVKSISDDPAAVSAIVVTALLGFLVILGTSLDLNIRVRNDRNQKDSKSISETSTKHNLNNMVNINGQTTVETSLGNGKIKENGVVDSSEVNVNMENGGTDKETFTKSDDSDSRKGKEVLNMDAKTPQVKKPSTPLWQRLLLCFSAVSNGEKILSVKTSPGSLTCLNGVRVLSIGWVILGHTFSFLVRVADNPVTAGDLMKNLPFQVIINGTLAVDSFFVLSGLLVTYLFLKETEKAGGVTVKQMILYYVHRYWRLTPAYLFMMYVNGCLVAHFTDGPTWSGPSDQEFCRTNWWLSILYVNNLIRNDAQCLGWGWYLAIDMQLYVIAPLALIPLALSTRRGYGMYLKVFGLCVIGGFLITSIVTTAYFVHDTNSDLLHNSLDYMFKIYIKPWCRVGTFAIGMTVGYIIHATKGKIKISMFLQGVGWFLALVAAGAITLSTYDEHGPGRSLWDVGGRTAHETLFRPVWGLVLGWVILMCCSGKAGIIDWMLSWAWWQPLARLTYGAFLIHPVIVNLDNIGAATRLVHFTTGHLVNRFFGYTCLSYIFAFLLAILLEAPLLQLEKIVLGR